MRSFGGILLSAWLLATASLADDVHDVSNTPTNHHGAMPTEYLGVTAGPEGVSFAWDEMRGNTPEDFPDEVYRRLPLTAFVP